MPALAALLAALALAAPAQAAEPRASLADIEDEVMCLVCNVPLGLTNAPQAQRQRALIRRLIARGLTKEQIKGRLVIEYGEAVLATPAGKGFDLVAWLVPIAAVLSGIGAVVVLLRRWRPGTAAGTEPPARTLSATDRARVDDALARTEV